MRLGRLLLLTVIVVGLLGLVQSYEGRTEASEASVDRAEVPSAQTDASISATWYCAAATVPDLALQHDVLFLNPTDDEVVASVASFGLEGPGPVATVTVPPLSPLVFDTNAALGAAGLSVLVETGSGALTVEHRLYGASADGDQNACSSFSSGEWHFPVVSTARTAAARITLFNPFPGDASVDIRVALDTGVRVPASLRGIVVPAGQSKVVDLGAEAVQRRDQFSATVVVRTGRVVAELTELVAGEGAGSVGGLAMQLGIPAPQTRWSFAGGFTGTGATEQIVVLNPTDEATTATIQVSPYGAGGTLPEPIVLEVPALRYALVNLSAETRVPPDGYHSITVDTGEGNPVVAARYLSITAAPTAPTDPNIPTRPNLAGGLSVSGGSPVAATSWAVPLLPVGASVPSVVFVHNPGPDAARVTATSQYGGTSNEVPGVDDTEIPSGESLAVYGSSFGTVEGNIGLDINATAPVVVEQFVPFTVQVDFALGSAIPVQSERAQLVPTGSR